MTGLIKLKSIIQVRILECGRLPYYFNGLFLQKNILSFHRAVITR